MIMFIFRMNLMTVPRMNFVTMLCMIALLMSIMIVYGMSFMTMSLVTMFIVLMPTASRHHTKCHTTSTNKSSNISHILHIFLKIVQR